MVIIHRAYEMGVNITFSSRKENAEKSGLTLVFSVFGRGDVVVSLENSRKIFFAVKPDNCGNFPNGSVGFLQKSFCSKHPLKHEKSGKTVSRMFFYYSRKVGGGVAEMVCHTFEGRIAYIVAYILKNRSRNVGCEKRFLMEKGRFFVITFGKFKKKLEGNGFGI